MAPQSLLQKHDCLVEVLAAVIVGAAPELIQVLRHLLSLASLLQLLDQDLGLLVVLPADKLPCEEAPSTGVFEARIFAKPMLRRRTRQASSIRCTARSYLVGLWKTQQNSASSLCNTSIWFSGQLSMPNG